MNTNGTLYLDGSGDNSEHSLIPSVPKATPQITVFITASGVIMSTIIPHVKLREVFVEENSGTYTRVSEYNARYCLALQP
jgi:hypothetical protein